MSEPIVVHSFRATVEILHHPTTIKLKYEPNVHCGIVRQSAAIKSMDKPLIRTGDKASVVFEFKYKPEFVEVGNKITFREGRTKGVGIITEIIS